MRIGPLQFFANHDIGLIYKQHFITRRIGLVFFIFVEYNRLLKPVPNDENLRNLNFYSVILYCRKWSWKFSLSNLILINVKIVFFKFQSMYGYYEQFSLEP